MGKVNAMKENYQKILDETIAGLEERGEVPKLLLHSCCAPCSSYVLEYLSNYFYITVLYYNPNIYPEDEYYHRAAEQKRFVKEFPTKYPVTFVEGNFEPERFYETVKGYENIREGGERCFRCYELRLREAAEYAKKLNCDYFTTTLSISPMKNAAKLNEIGGRLAEEYDIPYLYSDFKKRDGYKRSTVISAEYGMYRQDYCGCVFSKREREEQKRERAAQESEQTVQE
jgi:predicted adenine nucleotide alpha hydrolase (AANH) superfamily ATPase